MNKQQYSTRYLALCAMFTAIGYVMVLVGKLIPNVAGFLSYEPKDAIIVIAGFIFGPMTCVFISVLTALIEMLTISHSGIYGFLMNALASCAFSVPAAWYYGRNRSQKGAVLGLAMGVVCMTVLMLLWNYIVTPFYMGVERSVVAGMLAGVFLPFNLIKASLNAAITLLIYKPIVTALRRAGLVEERTGNKSRGGLGVTMAAGVVLVTLALLFLVMSGVL